MQLLRIERIPIEYQFRVESPRLEMQPAEDPQVRLESRPAQLNLRSKSIQVRIDTTDMRRSMGLRSNGDMVNEEGQKGLQTAQSAVADLSSFGTQMGQIQNGVSVAQLISRKILQEQQPNTVTAFIPSVGPAISWDPAQLQIEYQAGELKSDWEINKNVLNYVPGKFQIIIEQYPSIQIEYVGEPTYVPPSAAPGYEGETA